MKELYGYVFDENDDVAVTIDAVLTAPGIRINYKKNEAGDWIARIGDPEVEAGLRRLPQLEQQIIEGVFIKGKTLMDVANDLSIPLDLLIGHLKAIQARLEIYA